MARYLRFFTPEEPEEEDNDEYYDLEEDDDFSEDEEDSASLFCQCQNTSLNKKNFSAIYDRITELIKNST